MADILFIKTSSLGDVIHHMPALTEARVRRPDGRFAWIVEEAFAPLVRLHPAADSVIPVASRRWRGALHRPAAWPETWREMGNFARTLRTQHYDEIIDAQGLIRTGLIACCARGRKHSYDADSIKERPAAWFYDVYHRVERAQHAIARNRLLTALALGYTPSGAPDYGLDRARLLSAQAAPYGVLLHATARPEKEWPLERWRALAAELGRGIELAVPFGTTAERARSEAIASNVTRARVPQWQPLDAMARLIAGASFVIGVDTGMLHLAAALGVPLVAIFVGSEPRLTGPMGMGPITVLEGRTSPPQVAEVIAAVERNLAATKLGWSGTVS